MTVAGRIEMAHKQLKTLSITTKLVNESPVVVKATVTTDKGKFTGHSFANPNKAIEKQSPYEVAETSAVGRALGFAGYGLTDSIASADEMNKSLSTKSLETGMDKVVETYGKCEVCGAKGKYHKAGCPNGGGK